MSHSLIVSLGSYKFEATISSKITKVSGNSAIGKTTLLKILSSPHASRQSSLDLNLLPVGFSNRGMQHYFNTAGDETTLFYGDEDLPYLKDREFQETMAKTKSYFLLVTRNPLSHVPYSYLDIFTVQSIGRHYTLCRMYEYLETEKILFSHIQRVYTEDTNSGYQFFSSILGDTVSSASGKDQIPHLIESTVSSLFIADGVGFGSTVERVAAALQLSPSSQLFLLDSFEILILKSEFINRWVEPDELCDNVEEYGTSLLSEVMLTVGEVYTKRYCSRCFTSDCCYSYNKCGFYRRGDKQRLILGNLYDDLLSIRTLSNASSEVNSDREICCQILESSDSADIISLASQLSTALKAEFKSMDVASVLSVQMHCEMIKAMKGW